MRRSRNSSGSGSTCEFEGALLQWTALGMELAETEYYGRWFTMATYRHLSDLPGILEHSRSVHLEGRLAARLPLRDAPGAPPGAVVGAV
jgi:hypothetical protein